MVLAQAAQALTQPSALSQPVMTAPHRQNPLNILSSNNSKRLVVTRQKRLLLNSSSNLNLKIAKEKISLSLASLIATNRSLYPQSDSRTTFNCSFWGSSEKGRVTKNPWTWAKIKEGVGVGWIVKARGISWGCASCPGRVNGTKNKKKEENWEEAGPWRVDE